MNNFSLGHEIRLQQDTAKLGLCVLYGVPIHIRHIKSGFWAELRNCHCSSDHSDSTCIQCKRCAVRWYCTWHLYRLLW